jgi:hypothetical protein
MQACVYTWLRPGDAKVLAVAAQPHGRRLILEAMLAVTSGACLVKEHSTEQSNTTVSQTENQKQSDGHAA